MFRFVLGSILIIFSAASVSGNQDSPPSAAGTPVLWRDPGYVASLNLYYGSGGPERMPHGPLTFLEEDLDGTTPKFDVEDGDGIHWKVKMGLEARPEVAASRLVWAAGYFVQDNYFVDRILVEKMPARLKRGQDLIAADGSIHNVRLKRSPENTTKTGIWKWRENPFIGTREFNGLRVMMALINNLDLKDDNNRVFQWSADGELWDIHMVHDLGGSFSAHIWPLYHKGNLKSYKQREFIEKVKPETVDLNLTTGPKIVDLVHFPWYVHRLRLRWIGEDIPRQDARWLGNILGELSRAQIEDAFRSAGFSDEDVQGFTDEVLKRIAALKAL